MAIAKDVSWSNWGQLKQTFGKTDAVGHCIVFDVVNNRYRLIARVDYRAQQIHVCAAMDHAEYDKRRWLTRCSCYEPADKPGTV
ncbi:type II toxin-antitoxin system HigB family toxin [Isosphaeraceae bacterium EP7]